MLARSTEFDILTYSAIQVTLSLLALVVRAVDAASSSQPSLRRSQLAVFLSSCSIGLILIGWPCQRFANWWGSRWLYESTAGAFLTLLAVSLVVIKVSLRLRMREAGALLPILAVFLTALVWAREHWYAWIPLLASLPVLALALLGAENAGRRRGLVTLCYVGLMTVGLLAPGRGVQNPGDPFLPARHCGSRCREICRWMGLVT